MKNTHRFLALFLAVVILLAAGAFARADYDPDGVIVVSMGDSYSSGEGIETFYGQELPLTEKLSDPDWLAHRSRESWPGRLVFPGLSGPLRDYRGEYADGKLTEGNWYFVASSSALTGHICDEQIKRYHKLILDDAGRERILAEGEKSLPPQIKVIEDLAAQGRQVDYITITIGGNDMGFQEVLEAASGGGLRKDSTALHELLDRKWEEFDERIRQNIKENYISIYNAANRKATIIVAGYPRLLSPNGALFGILFTADDSVYINEQVTRLNREIESIVKECREEYGMKIYFVSVEEGFGDRGAYANDSLINPVILLAQPEDLDERKHSYYSIHPNAEGAEVYAQCVQALIDSLTES